MGEQAGIKPANMLVRIQPILLTPWLTRWRSISQAYNVLKLSS